MITTKGQSILRREYVGSFVTDLLPPHEFQVSKASSLRFRARGKEEGAAALDTRRKQCRQELARITVRLGGPTRSPVWIFESTSELRDFDDRT